MAISPVSSLISPESSRKSVVFPQPLAPNMPTRSPAFISKLSPSSTGCPTSKDFFTSLTEMSIIAYPCFLFFLCFPAS